MSAEAGGIRVPGRRRIAAAWPAGRGGLSPDVTIKATRPQNTHVPRAPGGPPSEEGASAAPVATSTRVPVLRGHRSPCGPSRGLVLAKFASSLAGAMRVSRAGGAWTGL